MSRDIPHHFPPAPSTLLDKPGWHRPFGGTKFTGQRYKGTLELPEILICRGYGTAIFRLVQECLATSIVIRKAQARPSALLTRTARFELKYTIKVRHTMTKLELLSAGTPE
jgi:hypothetical protein